MLYNGVLLPNVYAVGVSDTTYPKAAIFLRSDGKYNLFRTGSACTVSYNSGLSRWMFSVSGPFVRFEYDTANDKWVQKEAHTSATYGNFLDTSYLPWGNHDIYNTTDGTLYSSSNAPIDPNAPVESPILDVVDISTDSSSIHFDLSASGLSSDDSRYTIKASCFVGQQVVASTVTLPYTGPEFETTVSLTGLVPSTEYTVEFELSKEGEYTGVSQTVTTTTAAASGSGSGDGTGDSDSCACPSILNSILSAITAQSNFLSTWQQTWTTRMDSLETILSKLIPVPDPTETALKESVKETTQAVVDEVFADDSATKVTASDIGDMADSGKEVVNAFDTGTTVGDFFSVFTDYVFTGWFSEETRANLDSVNSVSTFGLDDDPYNHDSYNKNMEALDKFLERSGKAND